MEEQLITFDVAKLAKEKGFANKTPHKLRRDYYNHMGDLNGDVTKYIKAFVDKKDTTKFNTIDAPTQSLLQRWLREEHKLDVVVTRSDEVCRTYLYFVSVHDYRSKKYTVHSIAHLWESTVYNFNMGERYENYEQALEKGLEEALKLIIN